MSGSKKPSPQSTQQTFFDPTHTFGGDWTEVKLNILQEYLESYLVALKKQPFYKIYIDAFAGTGYRTLQAEASADDAGQELLFLPDGQVNASSTSAVVAPGAARAVMEQDNARFLEGSVVRALKLEPGFDSYHLIERDPAKVEQLKCLKESHPERKVFVHSGDANAELEELIKKIPWGQKVKAFDNRQPKAVLFLDPYGMNVNWSTLEAAARTQAIDVWYLMPVGMGLNRMLARDGQLKESWRKRITQTLGTDDWYDRFYRTETETNLFSSVTRTRRVVELDQLELYMIERLKTIFRHVTLQPRRLYNSSGYPMYSFCFAAGHARGGEIGERIANWLLQQLSSQKRP